MLGQNMKVTHKRYFMYGKTFEVTSLFFLSLESPFLIIYYVLTWHGFSYLFGTKKSLMFTIIIYNLLIWKNVTEILIISHFKKYN